MGEDDKETDLSNRPSNGRAQQIQTTEFVYNLHAGLFFSVQSGIKKSRLDTQKKKKKEKKGNKRNAHILAYGERKRDGAALLLVDYFINRAIKEVSPQSARLGQRKETAPSIKQLL